MEGEMIEYFLSEMIDFPVSCLASFPWGWWWHSLLFRNSLLFSILIHFEHRFGLVTHKRQSCSLQHTLYVLSLIIMPLESSIQFLILLCVSSMFLSFHFFLTISCLVSRNRLQLPLFLPWTLFIRVRRQERISSSILMSLEGWVL